MSDRPFSSRPSPCRPAPAPPPCGPAGVVTLHVVDDDAGFRASLATLVRTMGYRVEEYDGGRAFAAAAAGAAPGCALVDVCMPDLDGVTLLEDLAARSIAMPVIILTGNATVPMAVQAMKAGAVDFLEKPFRPEALRAALDTALARNGSTALRTGNADFTGRLTTLTPREREVLEGVVAGLPTKVIAFRLGISARTVDVHRARINDKLQVRGLSNLIRAALAAGVTPAD